MTDAPASLPDQLADAEATCGRANAAMLDLLSRLAAAEAQRDAAIRERDEARAENDHLRASLANSGGPCAYCKLPREDWAKCADGFPGCSRGDDAMLCPHVGAELATSEQLVAALARAERAETSRDAGATKLADELEGWFHRGSYRPGDHLPSSWQYDLGGRIARNMRLVLRALRSCPDAALAPPATAEET